MIQYSRRVLAVAGVLGALAACGAQPDTRLATQDGSSSGSIGGSSGDSSVGSGGSGSGASSGGSGASSSGGSNGGGSGDGSGGGGGDGGGASSGGGPCGVGDPVLAAAGVSEPSLPGSACQTIQATRAVAAGGAPNESAPDTQTIQNALNACPGKAVKLVASGANNAFLTAPLTINGAILWVDAGVTLYASKSSPGTIFTVTGTGSGIVGDGVIDGQGSNWWGRGGPALIVASGTNFVLYKIHLHNSPGFHVKVTGSHFVIWGTTLLTPSSNANSQTPATAHNTDGIDPGSGTSGPTSNGFIVCNTISVGDDHIAIKGGTNGHVSNLTIAHNHFGAGHGMSIGSETGPGGVDGVNVYDLTVDGSVFPGASAVNANGIRIKSYQGAGGIVNGIVYKDVCTRNLANPILLEPNYTAGTVTGGGTPQFTNITVRDFHDLNTAPVQPKVTLNGYDASHVSSVTLDNVVVDGNPTVTSSNTTVTLGPGGASFTVPGASGSGTPHPLDCSNRWVTFPVTF